FSAAPARVARQIEIWSKHLLTAARARFERAGSEDFRDELRIPGRGECDRLWEAGAALAHVAVKYLVMKNRGNAEPRVLHQPLLHCVGKRRGFARAFAFSLSRDLADAVFHYFRGFGRIKVTAIGREICLWSNLRAVAPKTNELRDLLF